MPKQYEFGDPQREELAWAAGFFDGEGTTAAVNTRGKARQIIVAVSQAGDHAMVLLERFKVAVGVGAIYRLKTKPNRKTAYSWRTGKFSNVKITLAALWPWLGPAKKAQAVSALQLYSESPRRAPMTKERATKMANERWNHAETVCRN